MGFEISQVLLLSVVSILLVSLISKKWIRLLVIALLSLGLLLQIISIQLGGALVDYKFIEHFRLTTVQSVSGFFLTEIIIYTLIYITLFFFLLLSAYLLRKQRVPKVFLGATLLLCIFGLSIPSGILHNLYTVGSAKFAEEKSFHQSLRQLGISPLAYQTADRIKATAGKNIIVISLESLEQGFMNPPFSDLTPQLQKLSKEHTFFTMHQNPGSGWTSGSMYTAITGMPAFFKSTGNEVFQNTYQSKIASLGHVFEKAGYSYSYLLGNKEFSGIQDMLGTYGFDVISEKDLDTVYPKFSWGLHDKDLFHEAKKHLRKRQQQSQPFALFLSTISSHFPDGVYDERWEGIIPSQPTNLEFMTAASDFMVGDFMEFLASEGFLDDTVVYIFPDHRLMGTSSIATQMKQPRELFFLTTAPSEKLGVSTRTINQIDIPKLIIQGAGIETNAQFLSDYIPKNPSQFILENRAEITSLNEASLKTATFEDGVTLIRNKDRSVTLQSKDANYEAALPALPLKKLRKILFNDELEYIGYRDVNKKQAFKPSNQPSIVYSLGKKNLYSYYTKGAYIGIAKADSLEVQFQPEEMTIFDNWTALQDPFQPAIDKLYLKSSGYSAFKTHGVSEIYVGYQHFSPKRGMNLLYEREGSYYMDTYDTFVDASAAETLLATIDTLLPKSNFFALIAHDSAERYLLPYHDEWKGLGFEKLATLSLREAYIAYRSEGQIVEFKDSLSYETILPIAPVKQPMEQFQEDLDRFIAHAGGEIDGKRYTNSLEALNHNYALGFRHFELDIIETSDQQFVAAHDWKFWKEKTGYEGETPVPLNTFRKHKIYETFTPISMTEINAWFRTHPDAVLVTDKINDPIRFSSEFVDKSRLKMELFSPEALDAAKDLGLRAAMASEAILDRFGANALEELQKRNVTEVTLSRKNIAKKSALLRTLKEAGIKAYVYHVNFGPQFDETYVMNYEFSQVYGMYADRWPF
ncbi:sulfatase-like hydrolase/transferase [Altibacter sp. HG106]|uniref:sulfatase-like hydrolase/transferase n=1 Tax=Altibacter sp. HG106 TaxID=3023937 RepID=UPI00234FCD90|nr:sulfatase-like hydrolase/transferase [Altibacter sp. HG106]MDC7996310.1 sulfatase-like hydrolase/transferase [Altibacter sp. HG106]